ncbi:TetR/AcrR family transcriptional regulator [Gulosibacter sp. 10]|uniref:TetR/AcrR family transcriptional regulator n=1 Tax=Gulosibacter sp. 10 TaxID=1255570 RepID=UPI00097F29E3|nr:TetR family transcriptional regulator [Gulosibacter sp. 10]SJM53153.1 Predicted biotin repressor from TetR family [Gulosibacter sp. 10]
MGGTARQPRRSREDIVTAAVALLDREGLPNLTMRAIGRELDVQPSALYWHYPNKQELLAAVADRIIEPVGEGGAPAAPRALAERFRDSMLSVTDGAEVVISTIALGLGADRAYEGFRAALIGQGREEAEAALLATALVHYCLGHVSHEQQRRQAERLGVAMSESRVSADARTFRAGLDRLLGGA